MAEFSTLVMQAVEQTVKPNNLAEKAFKVNQPFTFPIAVTIGKILHKLDF